MRKVLIATVTVGLFFSSVALAAPGTKTFGANTNQTTNR